MISCNEAEMAVLGCLLLDSECAENVFASLPPKCFYSPDIRKCFSIARKLFKSGKSIDLVTMVGYLPDSKQMLSTCCESVVSTANYEDYVYTVIEYYRRREIFELADSIRDMPRDAQADDMTLKLTQALELQMKIVSSQEDSGSKEFKDAITEYFDSLYEERKKGWRTGFSKLNRYLGGILPESFYIIAGRSGRGKTAFALNLALNLSKDCRVLYLTMEMPRRQILDRIVARICHIDAMDIRDSRLSDSDKENVKIALNRIASSDLVIDESQMVTLDQLESKILKAKPDIVFIDHVGLMKGDNRKQRWEIFTEISQRLKAICLRNKISVIALAQQTSDVEKRTNKHANMSDVKGSDSFSNDADAMLFIDSEMDEGQPQWRNVTIQIVKNRNGICGDIEFHWKAQYHEFIEVQTND